MSNLTAGVRRLGWFRADKTISQNQPTPSRLHAMLARALAESLGTSDGKAVLLGSADWLIDMFLLIW